MNEESPQVRRPPGRLLSAWRVLWGRSVTSEQLQWEWAEYQQAFNDLLQRYSAQLARAARAEKKRIQRLMEAQQEEPSRRVPPSSPADRKSQLRRLAASQIGLFPPSSSSEQTQTLPPPSGVRPPPPNGAAVSAQEEEENP